MAATVLGCLYEVQGLALCPHHEDKPKKRGKCSVPVEGEWCGIYAVDNRAEAEEILAMVMESDDPMYDRYDDFRLAEPTHKAAQNYAWSRKRTKRPVRSVA